MLAFGLITSIIFAVVLAGIYMYNSNVRETYTRTRLENRAIITARLLQLQNPINDNVVRRVDSLTTYFLSDKSEAAYDTNHVRLYVNHEVEGHRLDVSTAQLSQARSGQRVDFTTGGRMAVAYYHKPSNLIVVAAARDPQGERELNQLLEILVNSYVISILLVFGAGYYFSRKLMSFVTKIAADVEEISAQNLSRRIQTGKFKDEWYVLADTLNRLLQRLQESFEVQRRFISNASHEISTPLTSMMNQMEVASLRQRSVEEYRQLVDSLYQDAYHMHKLTQTLLQFAKAAGNAGGIEIAPVRVDEILLRLPGEMAKVNSQFKVMVDFENLPDDDQQLYVPGNEELLLTAFRNIVLNACKYSTDHLARVALRLDEKYLYVTVSDTGKGIEEADLPYIFQPFYRSGNEQHGTGFGLGLSLSDRIIRMHKGTITVEAEKGLGSVFTVSFEKQTSGVADKQNPNNT